MKTMRTNLKRFIYGAAYYEEYAASERLEYDLDLMEKAGINTIRIAESTWSVEEPSPGEFDFSHVTRVIEAAAEHGIDVIVGTPTYAVPKWLADLDPGVLGGNGYGPRQNMDVTDPTFRYYAERIIRELVSRTCGYDNVIGFQIDNETKHYGTHSQAVSDGFREWLRKRFGTIDAVNRAYGLNHWSNSVPSFDSLPDPLSSVNAGYIGAFEEYRRELAADYLAWQSDIVREYKRDDQFITHNFDYEWHELSAPGQQMGFSEGLQPDLNCYEAAKALDVAGTDIYFKPAHELTGLEIAFGGDLMRSLMHAPYIVMESQAQAFTGWLPFPGQIRLMAYSHMASGACGVCYWPWMSIHSSIESYWKGILSHDGLPSFTYDEVCTVGNELKGHPELLNCLNKNNRIALVVSPESLHAMRHLPTDQDLSYNDVVLTYYRALYELNLECDVIYDREQDWSGYDLIIFPELYSANDAMISHVRGFVQSGGTILASVRSFFADENLAIRDDRQPHGLTDVFGIHYSNFTKDNTSCWIELLEPDTAEVIEHHTGKYWGCFSAVTRNDFGDGHAWYIGKMTDSDDLRKYITAAATDAGIEIPELQWPVVCRYNEATDGSRHCFLLNYSSEDVMIESPVTGTDILTGESITGDDDIRLKDWGVSIISC